VERIKAIHGSAAVLEESTPIIFGLWSNSSLTRTAGSESTEDGYRSESRRIYAETKMRSRLSGAFWGVDLDLPNRIKPAKVSALRGKL